MSPQTARCQGLIPGMVTPKRFSRNCPDRGVIEDLRVDPAALAPGRDHIHRHPRPEPPRPHGARTSCLQRCRCWRSGSEKYSPSSLSVDAAGERAVGIEGRRRGRRHVIEHAVILIEGQEQNRPAPGLRVAVRASRTRAVNSAPWAGLEGPGMFGPQHRRKHPGDLRQAAALRRPRANCSRDQCCMPFS